MNYMYGPNSRRRHDVTFGRTDQTGQEDEGDERDGQRRRRRRSLDPVRTRHNQDAPPTYEQAMRRDQFDPVRAQHNQDAPPPTYAEAMRQSRRERRTAMRFMRRVAEFGVLSQLDVGDSLIFRDLLFHPNGRVHLDRAFQLACLEQQWRQRYNGPIPRPSHRKMST